MQLVGSSAAQLKLYLKLCDALLLQLLISRYSCRFDPSAGGHIAGA